ncbi:MAG: polysaccharide deacetylase family protein [Firmicutes bacterium]|nr:polysaccharide deacetylase family protein [Bacillota bacterium]
MKPKKNPPAPVYYRDAVAVLMYHNVSPHSGRGTITPEQFEAELEFLEQKGFRIIPVSLLAAFLEGRAAVPPNAVVLTFDDGYRGMYQYVLPVLKKHRAPAAVFLIGEYIGTKPAFLTWPQVQALEESGLVTIGGHTYNQHYGVLTSSRLVRPATVARIYDFRQRHEETEKEYENRMLADGRRFQETVRLRLGHETPYFAFPYGAYDPCLIRVLRAAGFRYMFTVLEGMNKQRQDPARLYRINAAPGHSSPRCLFASIQYAVLAARLPHRQPTAWCPRWKE